MRTTSSSSRRQHFPSFFSIFCSVLWGGWLLGGVTVLLFSIDMATLPGALLCQCLSCYVAVAVALPLFQFHLLSLSLAHLVRLCGGVWHAACGMRHLQMAPPEAGG